jgi:CRP-like cAMP-binding protein
MNEAINKSGFRTQSARVGHPNSYIAAPDQLGVEELESKHKRAGIKSIPFSGLLANKLLARLPGEDFALLLPHMEPVALSAGRYIYGLGDAVDFIYFPETVIISHIHPLEDGNMAEVALIGNEGMVGLSALLDAPPPNYWSQVLVAGSATRIKSEVLKEEFNRRPALQRLLLGYTSDCIAQISQRAVCNGRHALYGRLCSWLMMIHDRTVDDQLLLTHEEMARHLGARRASISVAATLLRDRNIIGYNRGHLRILDRQALLNDACECYRTLARNIK